MYVAGAAWLCQFARPKPAWLARKGGPDRSPDEQREPRLRQPGLWPAGLARAGQSAAATGVSCCRDAATARASSVRRISRNVTGTAASAVSPVTQNAHWNPPVSARGGAPRRRPPPGPCLLRAPALSPPPQSPLLARCLLAHVLLSLAFSA